MKIAHLSTFPEMRCGIAFYTSDLINALPLLVHRKYALHYGQNSTSDAYGDADVRDYVSLRELAASISCSDADVVSLQHEFGIWGGANGEHLLDFLTKITKPIITTLHTTFKPSNRPAVQTILLRQLVEQSAVTFVLSRSSRHTLYNALGLHQERIAVIPHGVPDIPFRWQLPPKPPQRWRFCAIGFFRPNKGIEKTLQALAILKDRGYAFDFVYAGSPQAQFAAQQAYLGELQRLIGKLQLEESVHLRPEFLSRAEQIGIIQESHAGIFAYQDPDQSSSGTIPLVLAAGRPVICTPFEFALAKQADLGEAITLADNFDTSGIVGAVTRLFASSEQYAQTSRRLFEETRPWLWERIGETYAEAFASVSIFS